MTVLSLLMSVTLLATPTWTTANSTATGDQDHSAVATNRSGDVAVVWEDDRDTTDAADDAHSEIYLRMFHNGVSRYEIKLSAGGTGAWRHLTPDVGLDDRGNAVVVWADDPDANGYYNIPYRVVSPTGSILASGRANANTDGQQLRPKVAVDPDGTPNTPSAVAFTVVWEDVQGTAAPTVRAAGFTNVTTKAYEAQASAAGRRPDVGVSAGGDATVVWDSASSVGLVRLARSGSVGLSGRVLGAGTNAAVAVNVAGEYAVAWENAGQVWTRSYTGAGVARHAGAAVGAGAGPSIGIDDGAAVVVGRTADQDVFVRGFNGDGTGVGRLPDQVMSQVTAGRQEQLAVAVSPWGEVPVTYTDDNDGNTFDQILWGDGLTNAVW